MDISVASVRRIKLDAPVRIYDATVPKYHNFALGNGVVVHNTAKLARDSKYQEVMRLTGKPNNAIKGTLASLMANDTVQHLLTAIGYDFDVHKGKQAEPNKKRRINKLILLPDADVDGGHIGVLVCALVQRFMPFMFTEGRVFLVDSALYSAYYKGNRYFGATFNEVKAQLPKGASSGLIVRSKGWGEIGHEALAYMAFDPKTRRLLKMGALDSKGTKKFSFLMGKETEGRKTLLGL